MMVAMAGLLRAILPVSRPDARIRYRELLSSLIPLARKLPTLRQAAIMSGFAFGAFCAYWTALVFFLEKPPYHYGAQMAGLLGLAGVAGALAAPAVGWLSDRGYPRLASGCALLIGMIVFGLLWTVGGTIAGLAIGGIVLDLGTQANLVTNQTRVYRLVPEARNRINTVFMVTVLCRRRARHLPGWLCMDPVAMDRRVHVGWGVLRRRANRMGCRKLGVRGRSAACRSGLRSGR
jgi:predicted MFS family arabinose efflux permease